MTSSASISSEIRIAPISAVNPVPTCATSATPAMIGVIGADALQPGVALQADHGAGRERHRRDHEDHAAADDQRAHADGDVADLLGEGLAVLAPDDDVEQQVVQDAAEEHRQVGRRGQARGAAPDGAAQLADGGYGDHQNLGGKRTW
ncbi:hypothetical protein GCM10023178_51340 [Actinomadura luteofluorescens]